MSRVLITGGAGFIGSNLALSLEEQGDDVVVLDRHLTEKQSNLTGFKGQRFELGVEQIDQLTGRFQTVFHHGDITDPRYSGDEKVFEKNLFGFKSVLNFARKNGAKLVYASTAGLYGNGPTPMREDQKKELLTPYGESKLKMDELAAEEGSSRPIVGLRYFNVFGPRESHKGRPASMVFHLWQQMKAGRKPRLFYRGEHRRDFIYVKDVVSAIKLAIEAPSGIYNVGTGVATSFNQLVAVLNRVMNTHLEIDYFPMPYDPSTYQNDTQADIELAQKKLKFTAAWGIERAVTDYVQWLEENTFGSFPCNEPHNNHV